jgi:hypothetical protein
MKAYKTTIHTDGDTVNVVHHSTKIIEHDLVKKTIKLNNGGWFSKTTKDRMNAYFNESNLSDFGIFQKKGNWFVLTPKNDHKNALPFKNGMIISLLSFKDKVKEYNQDGKNQGGIYA